MKNPKIRFKNDNGDSYNDWNKVVLGEHFSFSNGINGDRSVFTDGNTKCISVSDVVDGEPILSESIKGTANISVNLNSKYIGKR